MVNHHGKPCLTIWQGWECIRGVYTMLHIQIDAFTFLYFMRMKTITQHGCSQWQNTASVPLNEFHCCFCFWLIVKTEDEVNGKQSGQPGLSSVHDIRLPEPCKPLHKLFHRYQPLLDRRQGLTCKPDKHMHRHTHFSCNRYFQVNITCPLVWLQKTVYSLIVCKNISMTDGFSLKLNVLLQIHSYSCS